MQKSVEILLLLNLCSSFVLIFCFNLAASCISIFVSNVDLIVVLMYNSNWLQCDLPKNY